MNHDTFSPPRGIACWARFMAELAAEPGAEGPGAASAASRAAGAQFNDDLTAALTKLLAGDPAKVEAQFIYAVECFGMVTGAVLATGHRQFCPAGAAGWSQSMHQSLMSSFVVTLARLGAGEHAEGSLQ